MPLGLQLRLSTAFTAALYLGPLFAGMADHPAGVWPLYAGIFLLWTFVLRPGQWPRDGADWRRPGALLRVAATAATQVLLVLTCFAVGRGLGVFLPEIAALPVVAPLALSLSSIPLGRLTLDPDWLAFASGHIEEMPESVARQFESRRADRLVAPFFDLPDAIGDLDLLERLTALAPCLTSAALLDALARRIEGENRPCLAARRALILHATSPAAADSCAGRQEPVRALRIAGQDRALLRLLSLRLGRLLGQRPLLRGDCPSAEDLRAALQPGQPPQPPRPSGLPPSGLPLSGLPMPRPARLPVAA